MRSILSSHFTTASLMFALLPGCLYAEYFGVGPELIIPVGSGNSSPGVGASYFQMPSLNYRRGLHAGWEVAVRGIPHDDQTLLSASGSLVVDWPRPNAPVAFISRIGLGISHVDDEATAGLVYGAGVRFLSGYRMVSLAYIRGSPWQDSATPIDDPEWLSIMVCFYPAE